MSIDASCFEGRIHNADVISADGFWDASESRIWVVSVDDTGKVTPHIRPVEGLEAVFDGEKFYNMAKKKKALQRILGDSGDDFDIAIDILTQRRFPVKFQGRFALPPMRPFKNDDGNWTAATADKSTGKYTYGNKNGTGSKVTSRFRPKGAHPPPAVNHRDMKVDLPMNFIHVFGDPSKLFTSTGLTAEKVELAKLKFNEGLGLGVDDTTFDDAKNLLFEGDALSAAKVKEEFGDIDLLGVDALDWFKGEKNSYDYGLYKAFSQRAHVVEMITTTVKFEHHEKKPSVLTGEHTNVNASGRTLASKVAHDAELQVNITAKHKHNAKDKSGGTSKVIAFNGSSIVDTLKIQMGVSESEEGGGGAAEIDREVFSTIFTSDMENVGKDASKGLPGKRNLAYLATRLRVASAAKRNGLKKEMKEMMAQAQAPDGDDGGSSIACALTVRERMLINLFVPKYDPASGLNKTQFKSIEGYYQLKLKEVVELADGSDSSSDDSEDEFDEDEDDEDDEDGGKKKEKKEKGKKEGYKPPEIMTSENVFNDAASGEKRHSEISYALRMETEAWAKKQRR